MGNPLEIPEQKLATQDQLNLIMSKIKKLVNSSNDTGIPVPTVDREAIGGALSRIICNLGSSPLEIIQRSIEIGESYTTAHIESLIEQIKSLISPEGIDIDEIAWKKIGFILSSLKDIPGLDVDN